LSAFIIATCALLPAQQTVWFTPLPYATHPDGTYGSTDYLSLFSPAAPWQQAASHVQVFKLYSVDNFSDTDLSTLIANLNQRNIALALEWPVLSSSTCGQGIEGFGSSPAPTLQRIQALGGVVSYLAMEQPFQWGSLWTGANSCQWTAQQVAANALLAVNQAQTVFPNIMVGDISAIPPFQNFTTSWIPQYALWFDTWRNVSGSPLAFFHLDVDWTVPNWQAAAAGIRPAVEQRGIPFGMVYNGFLTDVTDSTWMADAENHFIQFEVTNGYAPPEEVDFQSWNPNPTHVLPETDPTAFTYLIDQYTRTRTQLAVANNGSQLSGSLSAGAQPVAGASILLTSQPLSGSGTLATYTIAGTVPPTAASALVGARIDSECYDCNGTTDVTVYNFQYTDTLGGSGEWDFSQGITPWTYGPGVAALVFGPAPYFQGLQITSQPGQPRSLTSTTSHTVYAGAQFTFQVIATVAPVSVGSGYFTLIWLDSAGNEPSRETIMFEPQTQTLGTATTGSDGSFNLTMPVDPSVYQVTAQYVGTNSLWPSTATFPANPAPSSPPAIVSLTPNTVSGNSVTFSVVFSDANGWAAIANAEMLINSTLSTQAACMIGYLPSSGTFQLLNDTGTAWSNTVLSNSQCSLSGASASTGGNNLTLTFTLNFDSAFGAPGTQKSVFLQVTDSQGLVAPWSASGTVSLIPGACTQSGTTTVSDVQSIIQAALGVTPPTTDVNGDGVVNVVDVQVMLDAYGCGGATLANLGVRTNAPPAGRREK
jgi:hypothetical protein